jgi:putative peptide zinc metalloprotease protein
VPIERPTFHESWYRVSGLHPRLRSTVQVSRQHFRGLPWHVVQDHTNNAFFRLAEPAYRFIGLLDGQRSVGDAWKIVNDQLGDDAPTQGEVIQLLGQLYTANLLQAEVSPDTHSLFARYKKRKTREITSYLANIMFARMPILDPDAFLNRWLPLLGWIFSPIGLVVWAVLIACGVYAIGNVPNWGSQIAGAGADLLSPSNLVLLYVAFAFIKACHEMGHAISCKKFGKQSGSGGEVHVIGIMFLIFTPVPYVDASSSWALQNKWHRAIVGAAGMWVELAIASVAAMVWANTPESHWVHAISYNIMFVASFSTIVFNANPLLRYDGYYILSDLLEIPNLAQRSKEYIFFLVKRYVWNVRFARNPAHSGPEQGWLFVYAIASFLMRMFVSFSILFYLTTVLEGTLIIVATVMAIASVVTWVLMPIGKFLHYLATSPELARVRGRAVLTSAATVAAAVVGVGMIPAPDHSRAQGVVEPADMVELFPGGDGMVDTLAVDPAAAPQPAGGKDVVLSSLAMPRVDKGQTIFTAVNHDLETELAGLLAEQEKLRVQRNLAAAEDPGKRALAQSQLDGVERQIARLKERLAELTVKAPVSGLLITPPLENKRFGYVKRADRLGIVADVHNLIVRAAAGNEQSGRLPQEASRRVEIRVNGRPDILLSGRVSEYLPAGSTQLPSASLGYQVGGNFATAQDDRHGTKTIENFLEIRIDDLKLEKAPREIENRFKGTSDVPLLPGQRVVVRFDLEPKPLAVQVWTVLLQLFQKKFHTG